MKTKLSAAILAAFVVTAADAQLERNPASELAIVDVATLLPASVDRTYAENDVVPLAEQAAASAGAATELGAWYVGNDFATPIGAIRVRVERLRVPGPTTTRTEQPPPLAHTHVSLDADGRRHVLQVVEAFYDDRFRLLHVTGVIVDPGSSGYARFALDPRSSIVAGTLSSNLGVYRIVQRPGTDEQLVFKLALGGSPTAHRYRNVVASGVAAEVARIEARHLQAEVLADIQPFHFHSNRNELRADLFFNYAKAGAIDPDQVEDPARALELLARLGPLTGA